MASDSSFQPQKPEYSPGIEGIYEHHKELGILGKWPRVRFEDRRDWSRDETDKFRAFLNKRVEQYEYMVRRIANDHEVNFEAKQFTSNFVDHLHQIKKAQTVTWHKVLVDRVISGLTQDTPKGNSPNYSGEYSPNEFNQAGWNLMNYLLENYVNDNTKAKYGYVWRFLTELHGPKITFDVTQQRFIEIAKVQTKGQVQLVLKNFKKNDRYTENERPKLTDWAKNSGYLR